MGDENMNTPSKDMEDVGLSTKLKKRLIKVLDVLTQHPLSSILSAAGSRSQAKAAYRMLANNGFSIDEVNKAYANATVERIAEHETVLLIQDTTTNDLNGHKKTKGLGYCDEFNMGSLVHTCIAITHTGIPLGILAQKIDTRPQKKDTSASKVEKQHRPIEEKESYRWIETLNEVNPLIPPTVNAINICDREGDFYEFYASAVASDYKVLVRLVHNRNIQDHQKSLDYIKTISPCGIIDTIIPRDTRRGIKSRKVKLDISFTSITFRKPEIRSEVHLPEEITATAVHVKENNPPEGIEAIEWFLLTTESVNNFDDAVRIVQYYVQRWKIERFHYVLKEGCQVEKVQERTFERQSSMIFLCSMIAVYIMALTYMSRIVPDIDCSVMFEDDEWKILYSAANKTKETPEKSYSIKEAVQYLAKLGRFAGAPSDGEPGVKVIWRGLDVLYTLVEYHDYI
jgi:hypothetical protein